MNNTFLINCLKRNINYFTQFAVFSWWISKGKQPSTFYEHVQAFIKTDKELQQFKHCQFYIIATASAMPAKLKIASNNHSSEAKTITVASTIPVIFTVSVFISDLMNLSSAITAVQGKPISILEIKEICNKWKLYYYCKLQHLDKNVKECLNKKFSAFHLVDIDDTSSVDESVPLAAEKV